MSWFMGCNTLPEPEPIPNRPPTSFLVASALAPNNTDVVLTWTRAKDPDGDPVTYTVVYKDTLVRGLTDTTYTVRNAGYETTATGTVVAYDSHRASSTTSFSQATGQPRLRIKSVESSSSKVVYAYDDQNRLTGVTGGNYPREVYSYATTGKRKLNLWQYNSASSNVTGVFWAFSFDYPSGNGEGIAYPIKNGTVDSTYGSALGGMSYGSFGPNSRTVTTWHGMQGSTSGRLQFRYEYVGENIVREIASYTSSSYATDVTLYEYDDKTNPFYNSVGLSVSSVQRYSKNNVTKESYPAGSTIKYDYEYNKQGLPVRCTKTTTRLNETPATRTTVYTYTYETY